jgi:hypothetical protein
MRFARQFIHQDAPGMDQNGRGSFGKSSRGDFQGDGE